METPELGKSLSVDADVSGAGAWGFTRRALRLGERKKIYLSQRAPREALRWTCWLSLLSRCKKNFTIAGELSNH